jgi:hypothetical protein
MNTSSSDPVPSVNEIIANMDNFFANELFFLIHVDSNDKMSLVKPFGNMEMQKNIQRNGYRCISHVWGTADKTVDYVWKDHGIIGITWDVETREEKRERLTQIFRHHKGYFWMDNFCIDQSKGPEDKPLEIMGDIYRKCKECICLLNTICDIPGFNSEKEVLTNFAKDVKEHLEASENSLRMSEDCNIRTLFDKYWNYLGIMSECSWGNRVWTWQEAVLPPKLLFCTEQSGTYKYEPFDREFLKELFPYKLLEDGAGDIHKCDIITEKKQLTKCCGSLYWMLISLSRIAKTNRKQDIWHYISTLCESTRKCTEKEDYVYGIAGIINTDIPKGLTLDKAIEEFYKSLYKQGIFVKEKYLRGSDRNHISDLRDLFNYVIFIDGIMVLGWVDDDISLGFNPDIVLKYKNHGKISSKELYSAGYIYKTKTSSIVLETGGYNIGDTIETTTIGKERCTFRIPGFGSYKNEIFEIVNNRVKHIGFM